MLPILGSLISAGTSLLGGKMASDATKAANAQNQRNFEQQQRTADAQRDQDYQRQEHFAKHGVQWRAQDAREAGIHPLYALGGNFASYTGSPVTVGSPSAVADTSMGSAVASMGQDIGRAINSTRTSSQREDAFNQTVQGLTLQKMGLENTLLASQIKRLQAQANPAFPSGPAGDSLKVLGQTITKAPSSSDMSKLSDRYGDEGLATWALPPLIAWDDYQATTGGKGVNTASWPERVGSAVWEGLKWADKNIKFPNMVPQFYLDRDRYSKRGPR